MNKKTIIITVVSVLVLGGVGFYFYNKKTKDTESDIPSDESKLKENKKRGFLLDALVRGFDFKSISEHKEQGFSDEDIAEMETNEITKIKPKPTKLIDSQLGLTNQLA